MKIVSLLLVPFIFMLTGCFKTYDSANGSDTNNPTDSQYLQVSNFTDDASENNNGDVGTSPMSPSSPTSTSTSTLISIEKYITISFSEVIDANTVSSSSAYIKDKNQLAIAADVTVVGNRINIIPNEFFLPNERYTIVITTTVKDIHGYTLKSEFNYTFVTTPVETTLPNDAVPSLITFSPANGTKASTATDIEMIFSENIAGNATLIVKDTNTNDIVIGTNSIVDSSLHFVPQSLLSYGANYSVTLQGTVKDLEDNAYVGLTNWNFSVTPENDVAAPVLQQLTPAANTQAPASTYVRMVFDEVIVGNAIIELKNSDTSAPISGTTTRFDNVLHFIPQSDLSPGSNYTVTLENNVTDLSGNVYTGLSSWSFSTTPLVDETAPTLLTLTPENNNTNITVATDIMISFSETIADNDAGLEVRDSLNTVIPGINTISANTLSFNPASDLTEGETYTVTVIGTVEDLNSNAYTGTISWSFTTLLTPPPGDTTPPTLTSLTPDENATDVVINTDITMTFDENIINTGDKLKLTNNATNAVVDGVANVNGNRLEFIPSNDLISGVNYTVDMIGQTFDLSDNKYVGQKSWSFTTLATPVPSDNTEPTLTSQTPAVDKPDVVITTDITMTFDENIASNGVKLEVSDTLGNTVSGGSVSGTTLSFNPVSDLTAGETYSVSVIGIVQDLSDNNYTGNTSWSFTTLVAPPPSDTTEPTLTSLTPIDGETDVDSGTPINAIFNENIHMTGSGLIVTDNTLGASVSGESNVSGNKLYFLPATRLIEKHNYTVAIDGNITDLAGNEYVGQTTSWSFTVADTTAPTVTLFTPKDGRVDVDISTDINVTFDENVTNSGNVIDVNDTTLGIPVGVSSRGVTGNVLWFKPDSPLIADHNYTATIDGNTTDSSGNEYNGTTVWSFTAAPFVDNTPPEVLEFIPDMNATNVKSSTQIKITFNEAIDAIGSALIVTDNTTLGDPIVAGESNVSEDALTFTPNTRLIEEHNYTVTVDGNVIDLSNNEYMGVSSWSFTVKPFEVTSATRAFVDEKIVYIVFSDALDESGVSIDNFQINSDNIKIDSFNYSDFFGFYVVTLRAKKDLNNGDTVTVSGDINDTNGHLVNDGIPMDYTL